MDEDIQTDGFRGKNVVVIGGSRGLGRAIVAAAHTQGARVLAVARQTESLSTLAADFPGVRVLTLDASDDNAPSQVFASLKPDILILSAGAIPHAVPLGEQSWEQFSRNWRSDVKISFDFVRAALNDPLPAQGNRHPDSQRCSHRRFTAFRRLRWLETHADVPRRVCPA